MPMPASSAEPAAPLTSARREKLILWIMSVSSLSF
jgi:hypothetical protein